MILVDIYMPALGNFYDFQLDETESVGTIIEEIGGMVAQKEHCRMEGDISGLMLCLRGQNRILSKEVTLAETGVGNGSSLILL